MVSETYLWRGLCHWAGNTPTNQMATNEAEVVSNLDAWYDAGRPQFTKEAIRKIQEQIDKNLEASEKITVVGLDGVNVEFDVETGKISDWPDQWEYAIQTPFISYLSTKHLKNHGHFDFQSVYCTLQVKHHAILQDKVTKIPKPDPVTSVESTRELFKRHKMAWEESEMCEQLKGILKSAILPSGIRKLIGLACGSFSIIDYGFRNLQRSATQHALLLTLLHALQEKNKSIEGGATIACFSQDPVHTSSDRTVLLESGIQPLDNPHGILEIDDSSVVFSTAPDLPVKEIVADIARPAILIWDRVLEIDKVYPDPHTVSSNPDSPRVREMINKYYDTFELIEDENFCDIVVYIRRTLDDASFD